MKFSEQIYYNKINYLDIDQDIYCVTLGAMVYSSYINKIN